MSWDVQNLYEYEIRYVKIRKSKGFDANNSGLVKRARGCGALRRINVFYWLLRLSAWCAGIVPLKMSQRAHEATGLSES